MSLCHSYVQFAPVAYIVKLHIELSNASLIAKVVRSGSKRPQVGMDASSSHKSHSRPGGINPMTSCAVITSTAPQKEEGPRAWEEPEARGGSSGSDVHLAPSPYVKDSNVNKGNGIVRTVETMVVVNAADANDKRRKDDFLDV